MASVFLAVVIMLYAAFIVASPFVADILVGDDVGVRHSESYLQLTMSVNVVVGSICVLLFLFAAWTIHRITCARKSTVADIVKTSEARRDSKWMVLRLLEMLQL